MTLPVLLDFQHSTTRQAIINGNFEIWQRGVSFSPINGQYTADRYMVIYSAGGGSIPSVTISRNEIQMGELPNSIYSYRVSPSTAGTTAANQYYIIQHKIENGVRYLCGNGKKVTLSFWARSDIPGKKIAIDSGQEYGTGGSPSSISLLNGTSWTLTNTWKKYSYTFTTTTLSDKVFGTNKDDSLTVEFWMTWGTNFLTRTGSTAAESFVGAGNIDIAQVQLCTGEMALPFQPKSFAEELRVCQRYYEKSYDYNTFAGAAADVNMVGGEFMSGTNTTNLLGYRTSFKVTKRVAPTINIYDQAGAIGKVTAGLSNASGQNGVSVTVNSSRIGTESFQAYVIGTSCVGFAFHFTADAEF